eukprot:CAMPEP_0181383818 /NCGR_PEP_ID=MMETSP1106-20121128/21587_1 /TAXON_ID=81844 /ORGANISM="Mantoniella antarctica, Strain SL-175" /LENGTH=42 /DNA_ID= /DNA_START= /DNA_END= /DNA_ORIENTATION=
MRCGDGGGQRPCGKLHQEPTSALELLRRRRVLQRRHRLRAEE